MTIAAPWTNVYGIARTLLALGTLVTLALHSADEIFRPLGHDIGALTRGTLITHFNLFALLGSEHFELARWIAVSVLVLVISGWRPRITGVLHWWITCSFASYAVLIDGGDQVAAVLTLFLVPLTLTDSRRWHWTPAPAPARTVEKVRAVTGWSALAVIRIQVSIIYLHAAIGKIAVTEWVDGTALYYWFTHPVFGVADSVRPWILPLLSHGAAVMAMTWGVIALELALFLGLVAERRYRTTLLAFGLAFHFGIFVVHGLFTFFLAMAAALILYLRPLDQPFQIRQRYGWLPSQWRLAASRP